MKKLRKGILNYFCDKYHYCDDTVYGKKERNLFHKVEFKVLYKFLGLTVKFA